MNRILCSVLPVSSLFMVSQARADDPPPAPSISVLVYYDGSAALSEFHDNVLLGFAQKPEYLPVVETADPSAFSNAIAGGGYQVFVGLSIEPAAAEQWENEIQAAGFTANLAAYVPNPAAEYQWALKLVEYGDTGSLRTVPMPSPEPMSSPEQTPPASEVATGGEKLLVNVYGGPFWTWLDDTQRELREKLAEMLRKIAEVLEQLKDTKAKVKWHVEVEVGGTPPTVKGKITVDVELDTTAEDAAKIAKALAALVQPPPKVP